MSDKFPESAAVAIPAGARVAIVAARFNTSIVDLLLADCRSRLEELGAAGDRVEVHRVPGAFELPLAAKALARTGRFSAVICLGAVVRGQTPHFDYVAGQCARGIAEVNLSEMVPVIFGVLTTTTFQEAHDRAAGPHSRAGRRAADAAAEMMALMAKLGRKNADSEG